MTGQLSKGEMDILTFQHEQGSIFVARPDGLLDTFMRFPIPSAGAAYSTIMGQNEKLDFVEVLPGEPSQFTKGYVQGFGGVPTWQFDKWKNKLNVEFVINNYNEMCEKNSDLFQ